MAATRSDIERWLDEMYANPEITHMEVWCDTFDYEDYPKYIKQGQTPTQYPAYRDMQRLMEVYSRNHTKEAQMKQSRAFNYD